MSALPWVAAPRQHLPRRVGTLDSGILEIPVLGGLTVDESDTISELLAGDQSAFVKGAQLADAIATEEGINIAEAFAIIEQAISGTTLEDAAEAIRLKHAGRIEAVVRCYSAAGSRTMNASITAIIRHRLDRPAWSLEDTRKLGQVLRQDIWQLVQDEQAAEGMPENRPSEEELGKQRRGSGRGRRRTGAASSGACAMPTPGHSDATPSDAS
jgi:hypothetical protein